MQCLWDEGMAETLSDYLKAKLGALRNSLILIAQQSVDGMNPQDVVATFEKTSAALATAKQDLAAIVSHADNNNLSQNLDRQLIQSQIDNLNKQLSELTARATVLL